MLDTDTHVRYSEKIDIVSHTEKSSSLLTKQETRGQRGREEYGGAPSKEEDSSP